MRRTAANIAKLPGAFAEAVIRSVELIVQPDASLLWVALVMMGNRLRLVWHRYPVQQTTSPYFCVCQLPVVTEVGHYARKDD